MDCSMPGFPVLHFLPEFVQTHVHWVSHAIQPSHPLSLCSPFAFNLFSFPKSLLFASGGHSIAVDDIICSFNIYSASWARRYSRVLANVNLHNANNKLMSYLLLFYLKGEGSDASIGEQGLHRPRSHSSR